MLLNRGRSLLWLRLLDPKVVSAEQLQPTDTIWDEWGEAQLYEVLACMSRHQTELPAKLCKRLGYSVGTSHYRAAENIRAEMDRGRVKRHRR